MFVKLVVGRRMAVVEINPAIASTFDACVFKNIFLVVLKQYVTELTGYQSSPWLTIFRLFLDLSAVFFGVAFTGIHRIIQ